MKKEGKNRPFGLWWEDGKSHLEAMSVSLDRMEDYKKYEILHAANLMVSIEDLDEEIRKMKEGSVEYPRYFRTGIKPVGKGVLGVISSLIFRSELGKLKFLLKYFPGG